MADSRRYKTEKGIPLLPGVNRLERGYNFTVEVPEGKNASLVLYKKRSKKPCMEIPFTSENKAGEVYSLFLPDFLLFLIHIHIIFLCSYYMHARIPVV